MSRFETFDSFIDLEALSEMDIKADNLAPVYKEIAEKIGLENTLILYNEFRGSQVHFGTSLFSKEFIHQTIIKEYNEQHISAAKLASKHHPQQLCGTSLCQPPYELAPLYVGCWRVRGALHHGLCLVRRSWLECGLPLYRAAADHTFRSLVFQHSVVEKA